VLFDISHNPTVDDRNAGDLRLREQAQSGATDTMAKKIAKKKARAKVKARTGRKPKPKKPGRKPPTPDDKAFNQRLGESLHEARVQWTEQTGGSVHELVTEAGVSYTVYYGYERGANCPSALQLSKILATMGAVMTVDGRDVVIELEE